MARETAVVPSCFFLETPPTADHVVRVHGGLDQYREAVLIGDGSGA
jgi:hypothetical protein